MTYDRTDLCIKLMMGQAKWLWYLDDTQGETITHGSRLDYNDACQDALVAFERAMTGTTD